MEGCRCMDMRPLRLLRYLADPCYKAQYPREFPSTNMFSSTSLRGREARSTVAASPPLAQLSHESLDLHNNKQEQHSFVYRRNQQHQKPYGGAQDKKVRKIVHCPIPCRQVGLVPGVRQHH